MSKKIARITGTILLVALVAFVARGLFSPEVMAKGSREMIKINILKIGKADAIIVDAGIQAMVIDTGETDDGPELLEKLQAAGINKVDTLIITHFDKDHVGGASQLLQSVQVGRVLIPDYEGTIPEYTMFMEALASAGITPERITTVQTFSIGDAAVIVEPPVSYDIPGQELEVDISGNSLAEEGVSETANNGMVEYDNNFSLITTMIHGDNRLVFMGDAEDERIADWLDSEEAKECDFLKVPHHGVYGSGMDALIERLKPTYAVITDSEKNPADEGTIELLKKNGATVYETLNGRVELTSNGTAINIRQ